MYFTRYEIRWLYRRCFYEGGNDFEYKPFDTREQAEAYIRNHEDTCKSEGNCECGLYKVKLFSNYDIATLIKEL